MSIKPGGIAAIETFYRGYRFRSRLEARWAVFFETLGISWEYEKEGFKLPSGGYLPDFWLPSLDTWIEIKPTAFHAYQDRVKLIEFQYALNQDWIMRQHDLFGQLVNTDSNTRQRIVVICGSPGTWSPRTDSERFELIGRDYVMCEVSCGNLYRNGDQFCFCPCCARFGIMSPRNSYPNRYYVDCVFCNPDFADPDVGFTYDNSIVWMNTKGATTTQIDKIFSSRLLDAHAAGRQARFEHGASPR